MNLSSAKIIAILGLSIILTNAGVAWALQHCLGDSESADHIHPVQTASALATSNRAYSSPAVAVELRQQPSSRIHCTESPVLKLWLGVPSIFRLEVPKDDVVHAFLPAALLNATASPSTGRGVPASIQLSVKPRLSPHLSIPRLRI